MTNNEFDKLLPGDLVREKKSGLGYVVTGKSPSGVVLVRVLHLNIPDEIEIVDRDTVWKRSPAFEQRKKPKRKIERSED